MRRAGFSDKHYKAILIDYDAIILNPPLGESWYCLTDRQVQVLLSLAQQIEWPTRYFAQPGTEIEKSKTVEFTEQLRKRLLMPCNCGSGTAGKRDDRDAAYDYLIRDDGDIQSYAPGSPVTTFDSDASDTTLQQKQDRAAVLCAAVNNYIDTVIAEMAEQLQYDAVAGGAVLAIITTFYPVVGMIIGIAIAINLAILDLMDNDPQTIEDVKCCMLAGLTGKAVTFENFKNALGGCNFDFGSAQAVLSAEVNKVNQNEANFRAFMVELALGDGTAGSGACVDCQQWYYTFDFRDDDYSEYVQFLTGESSPDTQYVPGVGYQTVAQNGKIAVCRVTIPIASDVTKIGWGTSGFEFSAQLQSTGYDGTVSNTASSPPSWFAQTNIPKPVQYAKFILNNGTIQRFHISGEGVPPFPIPSNVTTAPF